MSDTNQLILGALAALFSAVIIIGSMILAFTEGGRTLTMAFTPTSSPSPLPPVDTPKPGEPTFTPSPTSLPSATFEPIIADHCPMPMGWTQIEVLPGDTVENIAQRYGTSPDRLQEANCLQSSKLIPGTFLSVPIPPPTATATITPTPTVTPEPTATKRVKKSTCGHPSDWIIYIVQRKDTLYSIARKYATTVAALKSANCLTSNVIRVGQKLYVPNVSPRPPAVTPTSTPKPKTPTTQPSGVPTQADPTLQNTEVPVPPTAESSATSQPPSSPPPTNPPPTNVPPPTALPPPTESAPTSLPPPTESASTSLPPPTESAPTSMPPPTEAVNVQATFTPVPE